MDIMDSPARRSGARLTSIKIQTRRFSLTMDIMDNPARSSSTRLTPIKTADSGHRAGVIGIQPYKQRVQPAANLNRFNQNPHQPANPNLFNQNPPVNQFNTMGSSARRSSARLDCTEKGINYNFILFVKM
jgi:hypothetical protein